jgi:hypothetical protein
MVDAYHSCLCYCVYSCVRIPWAVQCTINDLIGLCIPFSPLLGYRMGEPDRELAVRSHTISPLSVESPAPVMR